MSTGPGSQSRYVVYSQNKFWEIDQLFLSFELWLLTFFIPKQYNFKLPILQYYGMKESVIKYLKFVITQALD